MTHIWIVLLMFAPAHKDTQMMTYFCKNLKCVNALVAMERHFPEITGVTVYQKGDADNNFMHMMPLKLNERKA